MSKNYQSENALQQQCYMWFNNTYPQYRGCLFAVPNGGARSGIEGKLFKETGLVPGVSDMLLMISGYTYCIEMKTIIGFQSENQIKWQKTIERNGFKYYIVRTLEEFKTIVIPIMNKVL